MNVAITEGLVLMPTPFAEGLDVWSSGDGTAGSDSYDGALNAVYVAADQDFGGCLELQKTDATQKLRYMGKTPVEPGVYLQISVRIKAISGNLPTVRIAGWAGYGSATHVSGLTEVAAEIALTTYGEIVELTAIVGTGNRGGVDMVWGMQPTFGHFGIDLTGANGGVVRIDDIEIVDITGVFLRDMLGQVDVRDYGAVGDGTTDDSAAFDAADAAADGRRVFVPEGSYYLGDSVTMESEVLFEGTVSMPVDKMLVLTKGFDLPHYIDAFGDEALAFRKAFQALLNNADHESLDLGGRKITVVGPIDMAAAVPNKTSYSTRRVIRNGQFEAVDGAAWETEVVTSQATYSTSSPKKLTNVANVANIPIGALVERNGVGREVYVTDKKIGAQELTLSGALYDAAGTHGFTFRSFKYMLDFSGFESFSKFAISDVEFQCGGVCSGIRLAPSGSIFQLRDCFITRPKDRGITSIGNGCQGMLIDRCQFLSSEAPLSVEDRSSIVLNANANDVKLRNNRAEKFRHFAFLAGNNSMVIGNHFFQGDSETKGVRSAGIIFAQSYCSATVTGNYIDNCHIEWTNELDPVPDYSSGFSFSAMSITNNIFLSGNVADWVSYIVVKPYGSGHYLNGVTVTGNVFRTINGTIDRVDRVDTTFAELDFSKTKNVTFLGNTYHSVTAQVMNPLRVRHNQSTFASTWTVDPAGELPFGAQARGVDGIVALDHIRATGGVEVFEMPYVLVQQGSGQGKVKLLWSQEMRGEVAVSIRIDT